MYLLHGDLTDKNVFYSKKNGGLYFIDFENIFFTKKWPLAEVVAKCFVYDEDERVLHFKIQFLSEYLNKLKQLNNDFYKIDVRQQVRFAVLHRCIHVIAHSKLVNKKKDYIDLLSMCLSQNSFNAWYAINVNPFINLEKRISAIF
jgi:thiamine kinase-like enzyme